MNIELLSSANAKVSFFDQMLVLAPEYKVYLEDYCAVSVFVKILMLRGYSFDETTFQHISFQKKVRAVS